MTVQTQMLAPATVLVLWSLLVLAWTAVTRFRAFLKLGINIKNLPRGGRGVNLEGVVPEKTQWKSHNYMHLMEQPTIFYPTIIILALMGGSATDVALAWSYVTLRIVHSLWQATVNIVIVRFTIFLLATMCLMVLAIHAAQLTIFHTL